MTSSRRRPDLVACGVDVGSTNIKAVAVAPDGEVLARASRPTPRDRGDPSVDAAVLLESIEDLLIEVCGRTHRVAAVSSVGVGEDGVLVGADGAPLARALAWFDPRRERVYRDLAPDLDIVADGLPVRTDAARTVVGWRWAAQHPRAREAVRWLALTDYAAATWTGRPFMSETLAARTAAWSSAHRAWVPSRVRAALGDERLLPEVRAGGEVVGPLRSTRLLAAGVVAPDAAVVVGGHDHPVAGWALHRVVPGAVLDSMGTAEVVVAQSSRPLPAQLAGVDLAPGICQPGTTLLCVQELARNMRWASREPEVAKALDALVAGDAQPDDALTSGTFIPGSSGGGEPCYTSQAPEAALSRASAVVGALATLGELAVQRVVAEAGGAGPVFAAGGWSRSPGWLRVKQSVANRSVAVIPEPELTAVGAALLGAEAVGWSPSASRALGLAD